MGFDPHHISAARTVSPFAGTRLLRARFLQDEERRALIDVAQAPRMIATGRDLLREGECTDQVHVVIDGWGCRYKTNREGGRQIPALLLPGDIANLDSLLIDRLDYGVRALTPITVVPFPRARLLELATIHPGIARTFTWLAIVENAVLSQWALGLGRQSARERLAHLFCELGVRLGAEDGPASRFELPLTQEHLADVLGLTPVHVNRTLQLLRTDDLIVTAGRTVAIQDVAMLRMIAGFDPGYLHADRKDAAGMMPAA